MPSNGPSQYGSPRQTYSFLSNTRRSNINNVYQQQFQPKSNGFQTNSPSQSHMNSSKPVFSPVYSNDNPSKAPNFGFEVSENFI